MPGLSTTTAILALSFLGYVSASCQLKNDLTSPTPSPGPQFCQPTGAGTYTFTMSVSEVAVPALDGGNAGNVANHGFVIYDNTCTAVGSYDPGQDNNCGAPYVIEENFLPYVLTVKSVNFDSGDPYFSFVYANGKYSIDNNHCGCQQVPHALQSESGCKCAFPLAGEPAKRGVVFEA